MSGVASLPVRARWPRCSRLLGPGTRVVLLPQADGTPSAVVVRTKDGEQTLSQPYQRATARRRRGAPASTRPIRPGAGREQGAVRHAPPPAQRYTLYFDVGGTVLTAASQIAMNEALAAALARSGGEIVVTATPTRRRRHATTSCRAPGGAGSAALRGARLPAERIEAVGRGERELAVPTADEVDEPRNRRVDDRGSLKRQALSSA